MCGNTQVRFLEEKGAERLPTYSTHNSSMKRTFFDIFILKKTLLELYTLSCDNYLRLHKEKEIYYAYSACDLNGQQLGRIY